MKLKKRGMGALISPRDPRDFQWRQLAAARGYVATLSRKFYTMVNKDFRIDQGGEGTCVGHAVTNVLLAGPSEHDAYPDFTTIETAHQFARRVYLDASGDTTYQKGTYPVEACKVLAARGLIGAYWRLISVSDITTALLTHGPVTMSVPWFNSCWSNDRTLNDIGYYLRVKPESGIVGYHEIALTGVDLAPMAGPPFVRVENSWGKSWAVGGCARIALDKLALMNQYDTWAFTENSF